VYVVHRSNGRKAIYRGGGGGAGAQVVGAATHLLLPSWLNFCVILLALKLSIEKDGMVDLDRRKEKVVEVNGSG
jgi:hypothetical protein